MGTVVATVLVWCCVVVEDGGGVATHVEGRAQGAVSCAVYDTWWRGDWVRRRLVLALN